MITIKILHYTLGMPPFRTGGLTKYTVDLMREQQSQGHEVCLLWPGRYSVFNRNSRIGSECFSYQIKCFELINPLPVPLLNGIKDIQAYTEAADQDCYIQFLKTLNPTVIHIHTLMGLHREFFTAAKELDIPIFFTSHDYFGICPKVNLLCHGEPCTCYQSCGKCQDCNHTALSVRKIQFMQSPLYRYLKDTKLVKKMRSKYKNATIQDSVQKAGDVINPDYLKLQAYYKSIFELIDFYHFNSTISQKIYCEYLNLADSKWRIINLSHSGIQDKRVKKGFQGSLRLTYLGTPETYKGFYLLLQALDDLFETNGSMDIFLNVYGESAEKRPYMRVHGKYDYSSLQSILHNTDLLVVPSICYETFGFTALEGKCFGVPVLVTDRVGAKDLLTNGIDGIITEPNYSEVAKKIYESYENREVLAQLNQNILEKPFPDTISEHCKKVLDFYESKL